MDIQAIIDGIKEAGTKEIALIQQKAEAQVKTIRDKAIDEGNKQRDRIAKDAQIRSNRKQAVIVQRAYMQSLQMHADARQELIVHVIEKTRERLESMRERSGYADILEDFIRDSIDAILPSLLKDQMVILHADKRDEAIVRKMEIPFSDRLQLKFDIQCNGGCEAESDDGMVRVLNTFESRFDRALPKIQQDLSVFFEEKVSTS